MKEAFVDTSCLAALALDERNAGTVRKRLAFFEHRTASPLLEAELRSVLRREGYGAAERVEPWLASLEWAIPDRPLSVEIETVLDAGYVRGADCWHLATALFYSPTPGDITFLTLDARQRDVAKALGFAV